MKNGTDSANPARDTDAVDFGNRKLIRPHLSRDQNRTADSSLEHRERPARQAASADRPLSSNSGKRAAPPEHTHAENFYYQKQIQTRTPMVVVTREGEELHGIIEWYDRSCIKLLRNGGKSSLLVYKSSIRYMYKEAEQNR